MIHIGTFAITTCLIIAIAATGMITGASIYNVDGAVVLDFGNPCFQLNGIIYGGYSDHEYGHYLQQLYMGDIEYYVMVAIPAICINIADAVKILAGSHGDAAWYHRLPWEAEADRLGANKE